MSAVACLGDCCLDVYVEPVGRVLVGGSCLNVAVGLRGRGVEADFAGPVGDDAAGERVCALLAERGLGCDRVRRVAGARTAITDILLEPGGERRFLREDYAIQDDFDPTEAEWEWVAGTGVVHSSRMPAHLGRLRALGRAGARVSYDFTTDEVPASSPGSTSSSSLTTRSPGGMPRRQRARSWRAERRAPSSRGASAVRWARRSPASSTSRPCRSRASSTPAGAGDAFMAAFLAGRLRGAGLRECLEAGAADGAAACLHLGAIAQPGFPLEACA